MIRTRFAPSPTGSLHVGNARIAVLNWLLARHYGGAFVLRIEDTDVDRTIAGSEADICRDLLWLGLDWDEGPACAGVPERGARGPYRQSQRTARYAAWAERLHAAACVYRCYCTPAELEARRAAAIQRGAPARYDGRCWQLTDADRARLEAEGRPAALRLHVGAEHDVIVRDELRGDVVFPMNEIGDFIVLRAGGEPTYNFAVVVDDIEMAITHVVRGAGHLSNTPRQALLFDAFGVERPRFAHVPTVLGPDRQKLSKRHGAQALAEYRAAGYHPDAMINYLSLLGWSSASGDEVLTRERLIAETTLERVGAADVIFDATKLRWLSSKHIEHMPLDALVSAVAPHVEPAGTPIAPERLPTAVAAVRSHLATFSEIEEQLRSFFPDTTEPAAAELTHLAEPEARRVLNAFAAEAARVESWDEAELAAALQATAATAGVRGRALYEPLRRALTGREHGPPFVPLLIVQGRSRVLRRIEAVMARIANGPADQTVTEA